MPLATPAVVRGSLIIRTQSKLYRIAKAGPAVNVRAAVLAAALGLCRGHRADFGADASIHAGRLDSRSRRSRRDPRQPRLRRRPRDVADHRHLEPPGAEERSGTHTFPEKIWGLQIAEPLVYVAADFFGLGILDVSNPAAPKLRGSLKTPGQAKSVVVAGNKAAVADHMSGVDFIDTSNADKPTLLGSFYLEGYAREVALSGSIAYAVDAPFGVYAFDMTKPGALEPISSQQTATSPGSIVVSPETPGDAPKLAVLVGGGSIQIYDLSKPTEPVRVTAFKTPSGRPVRAALHGSRAFVADWREGLQVVDLSNPKAPRLVASHKTSAPARDVAVTDSHVSSWSARLPRRRESSKIRKC